MPRRRRPTSERFWEKVNKTETCWLWIAGPHAADPSVGGVFQLGRGPDEGIITAYRYAWIEAGNEAPGPNMQLCHTCDTPKCVRPDHLFLGTNADNQADMISKGRAWWQRERTHCRRGHRYDYQAPNGKWHCRECRRILRRARMERNGYWQ